MDGLNPTLAFAALFFGLSGAHTATQDPPAQPELQVLIDCRAMMLTAEMLTADPTRSSAPDSWTKVLEDSVAGLGPAPVTTTALGEPADASHLMQRQIVPVATITVTKAPAADPCNPAE
jgi:hypothetical protein